ncbi:PepSY domain-containing protein [Leeia sp. TBRC 13508]|uniref:PepSY domain-containing protein n=1 Tax=Leeia speluncae TaxID=2884804 RepID=A0ABS8DAE3_9NEIS|nr:PepSY-associated TM helix domain-containing protein [Leeia speluncae]MCB6184578.1 PepSY domain-containing protein [Leeia speluncae]
MRSEFIRIYKSVHTWTGIIAGLALFIAFYAGAFAVFKAPINQWVSPEVEAPATPFARSDRLIKETLEKYPEVKKGFTLQVDDSVSNPSRLNWEIREEGEEQEHQPATMMGAGFDRQGNLQVAEQHPSELANFIDTLHRVVGLPIDSDANRWIMGVIAVLYTLAMISGLIVLLPSLVKDFFALRVGKNIKRMWLDAHNIVGIISLPFHLVMALTAVVFAFHDGIYSVQNSVWHKGEFAAAGRTAPPAKLKIATNNTTLLPVGTLLQQAKNYAPNLVITSLQYQHLEGPKATVRVWGNDDSAVMPRARGGFLVIHPYTGKLLNKEFLPGQQNTANAVISSFFALHMASFGGVSVAWMYFILAMMGAWLFYSGNLLWLESRRKKTNKQTGEVPTQRKDVRWMAALTVGVCSGCVIGISLAMAVTKVVSIFHIDTTIYLPVYYVAFFFAIGWAFFKGAANSLVPLLWMCVLSTLCIPLSSCINAFVFQSYTGEISIDLTAILGSSLFIWLTVSTETRLAKSPPDSVWFQARKQTALNQQKIISAIK